MNTSKHNATPYPFVRNSSVKIFGLILVSLVLFTGINAQSIFSRQKAERHTIKIDSTMVTPVPRPVRVSNGSSVIITGNKTPVNVCTVAYKREELKPEPNPFASFLGILVKSAGVGAANIKLADLPCAKEPPPAIPADAEAKLIMAQLENIKLSLGVNYDALNKTNESVDRHVGLLERAKSWMNCEGGNCTDSEFNSIKKGIEEEFKFPVPSLQTTDLQLSTLLKTVGERYKKTPLEESEFIGFVSERLDCYASFFDGLKQTREAIITARAELKKFLDAAAQLRIANGADSTHYRRELPKDNNAKITGTVTCVNFFTKQVSLEAIPFSVTYENIPVATVSAGALFSSLGKRQITVQPVKTGTDINGVATFKNVFAEIDKTRFQIIPFSFLNFYISGTRKSNLNFSTGIGVSSTNGKAQIEYFAGPSISFKNLFFHVGAHYGRRQELSGGFIIGETVPSGFPSSLPIDRRYVAKFAFGISYKIP